MIRRMGLFFGTVLCGFLIGLLGVGPFADGDAIGALLVAFIAAWIVEGGK